MVEESRAGRPGGRQYAQVCVEEDEEYDGGEGGRDRDRVTAQQTCWLEKHFSLFKEGKGNE